MYHEYSTGAEVTIALSSVRGGEKVEKLRSLGSNIYQSRGSHASKNKTGDHKDRLACHLPVVLTIYWTGGENLIGSG